MTDQLRVLEDKLAKDPGNSAIFHDLSQKLWEQGDWRAVHRLYEEVAQVSENDIDLTRFARELKAFAEELEPGPEKGKALLTLGDYCLDCLQSHDEGMEAYQKAFKAHPHDVTPLQRAGKIYRQRKDWERLLTIYQIELRVAAGDRERAAILLVMAQVQGEHLGDFAGAIKRLDEIDALEVSEPFAEQVREFYEAEVSVEEGILHALERAEKAMNDGPEAEAAEALVQAAQLEYDRFGGSASEALGLARQALEVAPENEDAQLIVEVLAEQVALEEAAKSEKPVEFDEALSEPVLEENENESESDAGEQGAEAEAEAEAEAGVEETGPRTVQRFYEGLADFEGDLGAAQARLESDRADVVALKALRADLRAQGDMNGLVELLEGSVRYLRKKEGEWEVMTELANLYWLELGDDEKAEYYFKRLKLLDAEHADVFKFYEAYYEAQGEWRKLYTLMAGRLDQLEDIEEYRLVAERLSEIAEMELSSPEKAIDIWKTFSKKFPQDEEARRKLRHLYEDHGKWNALVDVLKEEVRTLSEAEADTRERQVALLEETAHIYRTHLNLDAMVMNIMAQILELEPGHPSAFAELRDLYQSNRRFNDLATLLSDAADRAVEAGDVGMAVGYLLEVAEIWEGQLNNQTQAIPYLERVVTIAPEEVSVRDRLREIYEARRDFRSLFDLRLQETKLLSGVDAQEELADLLALSRERLRDPEREARVLSALLEGRPEDLKLLQELQEAYEQLEDWANTAATLERRAEQLAGDEKVAALFAAARLQHGKLEDLEEAARLYRAVLSEDAKQEEAFQALAEILVVSADFDALTTLFVETGRAEELYSILGEMAADESFAPELERRRATLAEKELKDPARVIEALEGLSLVVEESNVVLRELLDWYRAVDDVESEVQARATLLDAEEDEAERFEQLLILAELEEKREICDAALGWALKAFALDPSATHVLALSEELGRQSGMLEALVQTAMEIAEALEDEAVQEAIWEHCARIRWKDLSAYDEAVHWYEVLRERQPENLKILRALEELYELTEAPNKRIEVLKEQMDLLNAQGAADLELVDPLSKIADVQRAHLGEKEAARETYSQILDHQPEHLGAIRGLKELAREEERWMDVVDYLLREIPLAGFDSSEAQWRAKMELAEVYKTRLDDTHEALRYYGEILGENPEFEAAQEAVREFLAEDGLARDAAMLLEPIFRDLQQHAPLAEALEARLRVCGDPFEEQEILDELIPLYAEDLADINQAFEHARRQFEIDPERDDIWLRFEQLGARLNKWELIEEMFTRESPLMGHESPTRFDLLRHLAAIREHRLQQTERALEAWQRLHEFDPLDEPTLEALERLYRKTQNIEGLVPVLRSRARLVELDEDRVKLLVEAGHLLRDSLSEEVESTEVFQEVLGIDPEHEEAVDVLEDLLRSQERWHDLDALLGEQAEQTIQPDRRRQFLRKLAVLRYEGLSDTAGSVAILCDLLEDDPGDDEVLGFARQVDQALAEEENLALRLDLARTLEPIYRIRGEYDRLDGLLEVRLQADVSEFERLEILDELVALRQKRLKNPEGALEALSRAVIAQPDDEDRRKKLLELGNAIGKLDEVAETLEEAALNADPFVAFPIMKRLGQLATQKFDDPKRAIGYFERAHELDEADISVLEALERLFESTGDSEKLVENLDAQARFAEPDKRLRLLRRIGTLYDQVLEQPIEAIETYRQILAMEPDDLGAMENLERIYRGQEQFFDLVEILRRKVDVVDGGAPRLNVLKDWALVAEQELDDVEQTISTYRRMLEEEPAHPLALRELDRILEAQLHWAEWSEIARRRLEGPAKNDPDLRLDLQLRLARALVQELFEVEQGLSVYREVLANRRHQIQAVEALEELSLQEGWLEEVAVDLERIYQEQERFEDLLGLLERRRDQAMDPLVKAELCFECATLQRDRLDAPEEALRAFGDAWKLHLEEERYKEAVLALGASTESWALLVELLGDVLALVVDPDRSRELHLTLAHLWRDMLDEKVEAETHLREVLTLDPLHEQAFGELVELLEAQERYHDLIEILESRHNSVLGESEQEAVELLMRVSRVQAEQLEDGFTAVETLNRVRAIDPRHGEAAEDLKRLLTEQERWPDLGMFYEDKAAQAQLPSEVLEAELALAELCRGPLMEVSRAIELYGRALAIDSDHEQAIAAVEEIFETEVGHRGEAGELLEPVYRTKQNDRALARVLEARADATDDAAQRRQWLQELSMLLQESLREPGWAWRVLARLFVESPQDEAVRRQIWALSARASAWEPLGELYRGTMEENFEIDDALRGRLHLERALLFADRLGDLERGREAAETALNMTPDNGEAIELVERILQRQKAWLDLADHYRNRADFAAEESLSRHWYEKLAALYEDVIDDVDATVDVYARLLELAPGDEDYRSAMERILGSVGRWYDLADIYRQRIAGAFDPEVVAQNKFALAQLLEAELGAAQEAVQLYREILDEDRGHSEAVRALEGLRRDLSRREGEWDDLRRTIIEVLLENYEEGRAWQRIDDLLDEQIELTEDVATRVQIYVDKAQLLLRASDDVADQVHALTTLAQAYSLDPTNEEIAELIEVLASELDVWERLIPIYLRALGKTDDVDRQGHILTAIAQIYEERLEDSESAVAAYQQSVEISAQSEVALEKLQQLYGEMEKWEPLVQILERRIEVDFDPDNQRALRKRVARIYDEVLGQPAKAIPLYEEIRREEPAELSHLVVLERLHESVGDWEALENLLLDKLQVVDADALRVRALKRLAEIRRDHLERIEDAIGCFHDALAITPDDDEVVEALRALYHGQERWIDLIDLLRSCRDRLEDVAAANEFEVQMGDVFLDHLHDAESALQCFRAALEKDAQNYQARGALFRLLGDESVRRQAADALVEVYRVAQEWDELEALYQRLIDLSKDDREYCGSQYLALAKLQSEVFELPIKAFATLGRSMRDVAEVASVREELERLATELDCSEDLVAIYGEALQAGVEDPEVKRSLHLVVGQGCAESLGDFEKAIHHFEAVLEMDELDVEALSWLDRIYQANRDWENLTRVLETKLSVVSGEDELQTRFQLAYLLEVVHEDNERAYELYRQVLLEVPAHTGVIEGLERLCEDETLRQDILELLEPTYRDHNEWAKLVRLFSLKLDGVEAAPERADLLRQIAELQFEELQDVEGAFAHWCHALRHDPHDGGVQEKLESIAQEQGFLPNLVALYYEIVSELSDPIRQLELAERAGVWALDVLGDTQVAAGLYRVVLEVEPEHQQALEILEGIARQEGDNESLAAVLAARVKSSFEPEAQIALYTELASVRLSLQDYPGTIEAFEQLQMLDGESVERLETLVQLFEVTERWAEQVSTLEKLLHYRDDEAARFDLLVRIGLQSLEKLEDFAGARRALEDALQFEPGSPDILRALEEVYAGLEDWEALKELLGRELDVATEPAETVRLLIRRAQTRYQAGGDVDGAIVDYQAAFAIQNDHPDVIAALGKLYRAEKRWEDAIDLLTAQVEQCSDRGVASGYLLEMATLAFEELGALDRAAQFAASALETDPDNALALDCLETVQRKRQDWGAVVSIIDRRIEIADAETRQELLWERARTLDEDAGVPQAAAETYLVLLEETPDDAQLIERLQKIYESTKDGEGLYGLLRHQASRTEDIDEKVAFFLEMGEVARTRLGGGAQRIEALEAARQLRSDEDLEIVEPLLDAYILGQRFDLATPLLESVISSLTEARKMKEVVRFYHLRGKLAEEQGDLEAARASFEEAHRLDATYVPNLLSLGKLAFGAQDWEQAKKIFQILLLHQMNIKSNDDKVEVYFHLGAIREKDGDERGARDMFKRALRVNPEHEATNAALAALDA